MKRILKIIAIGIGFGVILLVVQKSLHMDLDSFLHVYWMLAPVLVIGAVLFNVGYNLFYQRKVRKLAEFLEEGKIQEYISGMEALLKRAKGKGLRDLLTLDLAAGYVEAKHFDKAVPMLEELGASLTKNSGVKTVYCINLCMSYFETGQYEKAMQLYEESQPLFEKYRGGKLYGSNIAVLDILALIRKEQYEEAGKILSYHKEKDGTPGMQKAFCELEKLLLFK